MPKQTHRTRKVRHLVKLIVASVPELTVIENEWRELLAVGERERERERDGEAGRRRRRHAEILVLRSFGAAEY